MTDRFSMFLLTAMICSTPALAHEADDWLTIGKEMQGGQAAVVSETYTKPIPLSISVDYTLVSDYIFRGINFSEYAGEGREDLNHQLGVGAEFETESFGTFGVSLWVEWFAGQQNLTAPSSGNLQEVDYAAYWSYTVAELATTAEFGWIGYHFPRLSGDADFTHEWYVSLSFDDGVIFGTEEPVLSPTVTMYHDLDDFKGRWFEFGVSHACKRLS